MDSVTQSNESNAEETAAAAEELNAQAQVSFATVSIVSRVSAMNRRSRRFVTSD